MIDLQNTDKLLEYYTAFATVTQLGKAKLKRYHDDLLSLPKNWAEMLRHPEQERFQTAVQKKFGNLER